MPQASRQVSAQKRHNIYMMFPPVTRPENEAIIIKGKRRNISSRKTIKAYMLKMKRMAFRKNCIDINKDTRNLESEVKPDELF